MGLERNTGLTAWLLYEDKGLVMVVEAEGEGDIYAEFSAEVAVSNGLGDAAAGAVVELGDGSATWVFLGFVHFGVPFVGTRIGKI